MISRLHPFFAMVGAMVCLSACGGGSSGGGSSNGVPPGGGGPGQIGTNSSVAISPSTLAFAAAGSAPQTFTVSSTTPGASLPVIDQFGCSPVVALSSTSTSLPATYTVTPQSNGVCTFVVTIGNRSATLGITVGGAAGGTFTSASSALVFTLGGPAQTYTATASSGTLSADTASCNGIVSVSGGGGASPQTFTVSPLAVGSCTLSIVTGSNALLVPIVVNSAGTTSGAAVFVSPPALSFASPYATPQQVSISAQGSFGQISIDESSCIAASAKIAYLTINGVAPGQPVTPPVTATVTPYGTGGFDNPGTGSCTINFNPQSGASASLTVTVNR
ncbi:MAG: hypothetical protein M3154_10415 [Candidatus Eremiobacteraeota bacterium]|nr:hypothetical protein [Candidatus Eremiobacteraeota bacterium]